MDVLDGQSLYSKWTFIETAPLNDMFELLDMGDKNFLMNSGSYFIIMFASMVFFLVKKLIEKVAIRFSYNKNPYHSTIRRIGMAVHEKSYLTTFRNASFKLYIECFFDLCLCAILSMLSLDEVHVADQFGTWADSVNITLGICYTFSIFVMPFLATYIIRKHYHVLGTRQILTKYGVLYQDYSTKTMA
jgi:hypothetical protein